MFVIFAKEKITNNNLIIITWTEIFGWGDRMFAFKTCKIINSHIKCNIIIYPKTNNIEQQNDITKLFHCFTNCTVQFKFNDVYILSESYINPLILDVATPDSYNEVLQSLTKNIIKIDEYCGNRSVNMHDDKNWYCAGIGFCNNMKTIGIFLDKSLQINVKSNYTIQNVFFGYISVEGATIDKFNSLKLFINTITQCNKYNSMNIKFIFINKHCIDPLYTLFLLKLKFNKNVENNTFSKIYSNGRCVIINTCETATHAEIAHWMQKSAPEILVTGDQSLTEALSIGNKIIFYQTQPWKTRLIENITNLTHNKPFSNVIYSFFRNIMTESYDTKEQAALIDDPHLLIDFKMLSQFLYAKYDISKQLIGIIKKQLIHPDQINKTRKLVETQIINELPRKIRKLYYGD